LFRFAVIDLGCEVSAHFIAEQRRRNGRLPKKSRAFVEEFSVCKNYGLKRIRIFRCWLNLIMSCLNDCQLETFMVIKNEA